MSLSVRILGIYTALEQHLVDAQSDDNPLSRTSRTVKETFNKAFQPFADTVGNAKESIKHSKLTAAKKMVVKLDAQQKRRPFMQGGYQPQDAAFRKCISCKHHLVDIPNECNFFRQPSSFYSDGPTKGSASCISGTSSFCLGR
jgi:hypothetical protein